jgi:hypothetical protein
VVDRVTNVASGTGGRRRFGIIVIRCRTAGRVCLYDPTVNGPLWACVA